MRGVTSAKYVEQDLIGGYATGEQNPATESRGSGKVEDHVVALRLPRNLCYEYAKRHQASTDTKADLFGGRLLNRSA